MNDTDAGDFLTVAAAAEVLGIDARQVRRYAARLRTQDRTPEGQCPVRVRVSAIEALRGAARDRKPPKDTGQDRDRTLSAVRVSEAEVRLLQELLAEKDRRIAALESNVADLRRMLPPAPEAEAPRRPWWPFGRRKHDG